MKVFGWVAERDGCSWYRMEQPMDLLGIPHDTTLPREVAFDGSTVVVAQRTYTPGPSHVLDVRCSYGHPTIYELDDLLWKIDSWNPSRNWIGPAEVKRVLKHVLNVDLVIVSTEPLADEILNVRPEAEIEVIPNYIPQSLLDLGDGFATEGPAVIGYPASPSHARDVLSMQAGLSKVLRKTDATFRCIGTDFLDHLRVEGEFIEGSESVARFYELLRFDILVAPLKESRFNDCKSPIKVMEAAARGIPAVASNFGPYARYVDHGVDGFLCDSESDWFKYLRELVRNSELRREMGEAARDKVSKLTYELHAHEWQEVFDSL